MKKLLTIILLACAVGVAAQTTTQYAYDNLGRLTKVTYTSGAIQTYTYDANGNRISEVKAGGTNVFSIAATVSPANSGAITGAGNYSSGQQVSLSAVANAGYSFTNWTENGTVVSTSASYSFTVTGNRTLVGNFKQVTNFTITTSSSPTAGGATTGGGSYNSGTTCNITATPANGYTFTNWTENGVIVYTSASYSFTVMANRILLANFSSVDLTSGLVAYYPFNGNANDESGNGNDATVNGATLSTDIGGNVNSGSYNFYGSSKISYISVPNSSTLKFNNEATFSVFVKQNSWKGQNGWGNFIEDGSVCLLAKSSDENGFGIAYQGSPNGVRTWLGTYESWVKDKTLSTESNYSYKNKFAELSASVAGDFTNKWVHIVYCIDSKGIRIYINGELIKETTSLMEFSKTNLQDLHFGRYANGWFRLDGVLDDIRIYNRALSDNEITKLFNQTLIPTLIDNISINETLKLSPNPAKTFLRITSPEILQRIEIYDIAGKLKLSKTIKSDKCTLETDNFVKGIYIVKGFTYNGFFTSRFVKD